MSLSRASEVAQGGLHWWVFAALALASVAGPACGLGGNESIDDNFTSVPHPSTDGSGGGSTPLPSDGNGGATSPNVAAPSGTNPNTANPNTPGATSPNAPTNTTPAVDPNVVAILAQTNANAAYGVGFALQALDYPGYCLASATGGAPANSALRLAQCANSADQAFGWSTGHFALNKLVCMSGAVSQGSLVTLQNCQANVQQNWLLPPDTQLVSRILPGVSTVQALAVDPASYQTSQIYGQTPTAGGGLRLAIAPLVQTEGIRIHAKVNGSDLCLQDLAPVAKLAGCGAGGGAQVWRMVAGQWRSATGKCLLADVAARTVTLGACSAQPTTSAQWVLMGGFVTPVAATSSATSTSLVLDVDTANSTFKLSPPAGLTPLVAIGAPTGLF